MVFLTGPQKKEQISVRVFYMSGALNIQAHVHLAFPGKRLGQFPRNFSAQEFWLSSSTTSLPWDL